MLTDEPGSAGDERFHRRGLYCSSAHSGGEFSAQQRDRVEVVVQKLLAHHPTDACLAQRQEPLGRLVERGDDPRRRRV